MPEMPCEWTIQSVDWQNLIVIIDDWNDYPKLYAHVTATYGMPTTTVTAGPLTTDAEGNQPIDDNRMNAKWYEIVQSINPDGFVFWNSDAMSLGHNITVDRCEPVNLFVRPGSQAQTPYYVATQPGVKPNKVYRLSTNLPYGVPWNIYYTNPYYDSDAEQYTGSVWEGHDVEFSTPSAGGTPQNFAIFAAYQAQTATEGECVNAAEGLRNGTYWVKLIQIGELEENVEHI